MRGRNRPKRITSALVVAWAGIALIGLQGCADSTLTELRNPTSSAVVPLTTVVESDQSGIQDIRRLVIRDEATWEAFWTELAGPSTNAVPIPKVDFTKDMILVATLGTKPTGGYTVSLGPIVATDTLVTAYVQKVVPGMKCGTTEIVTHPFSIASLPRTDLPVQFVETEQVRDCS